MHTPKIRTYVGISLDGFLSTPNGLTTWEALPTRTADKGTEEYWDQCDAVVIGRTTFDQGLPFWDGDNWPYKGKQVFILTSRPLPEGVQATAARLDTLVDQLQSAGLEKDVNLLGGARTIQTLWEMNLIDELGVCLLPVLLGEGIPFFKATGRPYSEEAWQGFLANPPESSVRPTLQLLRHQAYPDGAVELVYRKGN